MEPALRGQPASDRSLRRCWRVERYVYAGTNALAPELILRADGSQWRVVTDAIGSVRRVVNVATGAVVQALDYGPFGNVLSDSAPGATVFGYAGGLYDADTHLSHFGAREYDAETGLWTSKDPLLFAGGDSNLYAYALGDPVDYVDPDGRFIFVVGALALVGAIAASLWWPSHAGEEAPKNSEAPSLAATVGGGIAGGALALSLQAAVGRVCAAFGESATAETTTLYRAVSQAEYAELVETGEFAALLGFAWVRTRRATAGRGRGR